MRVATMEAPEGLGLENRTKNMVHWTGFLLSRNHLSKFFKPEHPPRTRYGLKVKGVVKVKQIYE